MDLKKLDAALFPQFQEVPTKTPTMKEMDNFAQYIEQFSRDQSAWSETPAVVIVPPKEWVQEKAEEFNKPKYANEYTKISALTQTLTRLKPGVYRTHFPGNDTLSAPAVWYEKEDITEREFWNPLKIDKRMAKYGTDLPTSILGDDFWGKSALTEIKRELNLDVPGVTSPYCYLGAPNSYFALHKEDYDLLSINYLHRGAPKVWYLFLPSDSERIKQFCRLFNEKEYLKCSEFYRHKDTLIDPRIFLDNIPDLKIFKIKHTPGSFVLTGPGAFHEGYNSGLNYAEAINVFTPEWLRFLVKSNSCRCAMTAINWHPSELISKIKDSEKTFTREIHQFIENYRQQNPIIQFEYQEEHFKNCSPISNSPAEICPNSFFPSIRSTKWLIIAKTGTASREDILKILDKNKDKFLTNLAKSPLSKGFFEIYSCDIAVKAKTSKHSQYPVSLKMIAKSLPSLCNFSLIPTLETVKLPEAKFKSPKPGKLIFQSFQVQLCQDFLQKNYPQTWDFIIKVQHDKERNTQDDKNAEEEEKNLDNKHENEVCESQDDEGEDEDDQYDDEEKEAEPKNSKIDTLNSKSNSFWRSQVYSFGCYFEMTRVKFCLIDSSGLTRIHQNLPQNSVKPFWELNILKFLKTLPSNAKLIIPNKNFINKFFGAIPTTFTTIEIFPKIEGENYITQLMQELGKNVHYFESLTNSASIDIQKIAAAQYVIYKNEEIHIDFRICFRSSVNRFLDILASEDQNQSKMIAIAFCGGKTGWSVCCVNWIGETILHREKQLWKKYTLGKMLEKIQVEVFPHNYIIYWSSKKKFFPESSQQMIDAAKLYGSQSLEMALETYFDEKFQANDVLNRARSTIALYRMNLPGGIQ